MGLDRPGCEVLGESSTSLALGLSELGGAWAGLQGSSAGAALDVEAGAVLGLALPSRKGDDRTG